MDTSLKSGLPGLPRPFQTFSIGIPSVRWTLSLIEPFLEEVPPAELTPKGSAVLDRTSFSFALKFAAIKANMIGGKLRIKILKQMLNIDKSKVASKWSKKPSCHQDPPKMVVIGNLLDWWSLRPLLNIIYGQKYPEVDQNDWWSVKNNPWLIKWPIIGQKYPIYLDRSSRFWPNKPMIAKRGRDLAKMADRLLSAKGLLHCRAFSGYFWPHLSKSGSLSS